MSDIHHDMTIDELRRTLGMEADEVQRRARAARRRIFAVRAMLQKLPQEGLA